MIAERKELDVEVQPITHDGTFSTRGGMVQGKNGDKLVYDPNRAVYVKGENPRLQPHNWDLVAKDVFEKDYADAEAPEDAKLKPKATDFGIHQFDEFGVFLGYKSQKELDAEAKAIEDARLEAEAARAERERVAQQEAKAKSDAEVKPALDAADAKAKADAEGRSTAPIPAVETAPIK